MSITHAAQPAAPRFGAVKPEDIKPGAVFVSKNSRFLPDEPRSLVEVTEVLGKPEWRHGLTLQDSDPISGCLYPPYETPPSQRVPYNSNVYHEQEDGSFLKDTRSGGMAFGFPDGVQPLYDPTEITDRSKNGNYVWIA